MSRAAALKTPELIDNLRQGYNFNTLKTLSIVCNSLVLPTPIGIPLSLNLSANAILKVDGYVKATSLPSFGDFVRSRPYMTKKIEIETMVRPRSVTISECNWMTINKFVFLMSHLWRLINLSTLFVLRQILEYLVVSRCGKRLCYIRCMCILVCRIIAMLFLSSDSVTHVRYSHLYSSIVAIPIKFTISWKWINHGLFNSLLVFLRLRANHSTISHLCTPVNTCRRPQFHLWRTRNDCACRHIIAVFAAAGARRCSVTWASTSNGCAQVSLSRPTLSQIFQWRAQWPLIRLTANWLFAWNCSTRQVT